MSSLYCGNFSVWGSSPHPFTHCSLGLVWDYPKCEPCRESKKDAQYISLLVTRNRNSRTDDARSLQGNMRQIWTFSFFCPNLTNDHMAHLLLSKSFIFFFSSSHANRYLYASCGNHQSHITLCPSILISLYPRKVHGSKYGPIGCL